MATAKKATKKATKKVAKRVVTAPAAAAASSVTSNATSPAPAIPTGDALIKQAYIISAHAHVAKQKLEIGDGVRVNNRLLPTGPIYGNSALPAGCELRETSDAPRGENNVIFRGVNADGDLMVRYSGRDYPMPYTFVMAGGSEVQRASLRLNDGYTGTVLGDGSQLAVGCQRFKTAKLREFLSLADKTIAARTAITSRSARAVTANPTATYQPTPARAAKKAVRSS